MGAKILQRMRVGAMASVLAAAAMALAGGDARAVLITSDLALTGTLDHNAISFAAVGNATQGGTMSLISGGATSTSTIMDNAVSAGANPLTGGLTDTGDGIGIDVNMSGSFLGGIAQTDGMFIDLEIGIANISASDYKVTFKVEVNNNVDSQGMPGTGAFAFSTIELDRRDGPTTASAFRSGLETNTLFPGQNQKNGVPTGVQGGPINDTRTEFVDVTVLAGTTGFFRTDDLLSGTQLLVFRGGALEFGTSYSLDAALLVTVDSVMNLTAPPPPTPVPEPGSLALFGIGLFGLARLAHARRRRDFHTSLRENAS